MFDPREKIALFIDGANLYATSRALGFDIDYRKLLSQLPEARLSAARLLLHRAGRGSGILVDPAADRLARLQRLQGRDQAGQGIHRLHRPAQDQGQHGHRADRRCPRTGRVRRPLSSSSPATAISARWSRRCSGAGRKVSIVSTMTSQPPMISDDLRRQADHFIDLMHAQGRGRPRPVRTAGAPARAAVEADDDY